MNPNGIKGTKTLNDFERQHLLMSLKLMRQYNLTSEDLQELSTEEIKCQADFTSSSKH